MISEKDLMQISSFSNEYLSDLADQTLLVTGATGFVGTWLVESILKCSTKAPRIVLIVRSKVNAEKHFRSVSNCANIQFIEQDVSQKIEFKGTVDQIWHLATSTAQPNGRSSIDITNSTILGTFRLLDLASNQSSPPKFLHTSSGAVYGRGLNPDVEVTEDLRLTQDWLNASEVYDTSKRATEMVLQEATKEGVVSAKNARLFAFVGPHLPLDSHFAIGNFIRSALDSKPITLTSSGVDYRSYLYAADLVSWLFSYMHSDYNEPLNIGSDQQISIRECAELVGSFANVEVVVNSSDTHEATKYVPNIDRARSVLGLDVYTDLSESIKRTIDWHKSQSNVK
jgi:dTDP-glucose 4,6-dehydratase